MEVTTLGRTGLQVSVMGLGCGGHSRLGLSIGRSNAEAADIVRAALDLGVNFIDTAEAYQTEDAVGEALHGAARDRVVISTKVGVYLEGRRATGAETKQRVEACLKRLRTDYVDILHLHGVSAEDYAYAREELAPALRELQQEGKIRFPGITEQFINDPVHQMLGLALKDDCWDVMMVGFSLLNQSARERVLEQTRQQGIGTLCMFAVRRALSRPDALRELMADLVARGLVDANAFDPADPLDFLTRDGIAASIPEAAYRFCRWEPGIDVTLSGTGSITHLRENAASLDAPPLPEAVNDRLRALFAGVDCISGN